MSTHVKRKADAVVKGSVAKVARTGLTSKKKDSDVTEGIATEGGVAHEAETEIRSSTTEGSDITEDAANVSKDAAIEVGRVGIAEVDNVSPPVKGTTSVDSADVANSEDPGEQAISSKRALSPEWVVSPSGAKFPQRLLGRLSDLFSFEDPGTDRFYIGLGPQELSWGQGEMELYLCRAGMNNSVLWWWVAELSKDFFLCAPGGNPSTSISMNVYPVRNSDDATVQRLLRDNQTYAGPGSAIDTPTIHLSRRTYTESRSKKRVPYVFKDAFDGRVAVGPKSAMKDYSVDEVGRGDLLLLECYVTRYRCDDQGKVIYSGGWNRYRSSLEFRYVTLLREGEDVVVQEPVIDDSKMKRM
ncbi:hypothetical protein OH76DRAFT_1417668 [Lentinus brumalis]|uniref:Uncharacterized protein n=1 Tax=Lentinus brumalis TaxID=2498619 RepID=A0A371DEL9_9APHY|nr:hypothetical protein OH76DRAFT_1417668 [Polyporus brumalis]